MTRRRRPVNRLAKAPSVPAGREVLSFRAHGDPRAAVFKLVLRDGTTERVAMGATLLGLLADALAPLAEEADSTSDVAQFRELEPAIGPADLRFAVQHEPGAMVALAADVARAADGVTVSFRPSTTAIAHYRFSPGRAHLLLRGIRAARRQVGAIDLDLG